MFRAVIRPTAYLELLNERHSEELFALVERNRTYLRKWLSWVDATRSEEDILSFIRSAREEFAANRGIAAGIWSEGQIAGVIGAHRVDFVNRKAESGYWIAEDYQGKGLVTDACRAIVTHLLDDLDLHRVEIMCATGNTKSAAIPQRLGFTFEGTAREANLVDGKYHDLLRFAILKQDWKP